MSAHAWMFSAFATMTAQTRSLAECSIAASSLCPPRKCSRVQQPVTRSLFSSASSPFFLKIPREYNVILFTLGLKSRCCSSLVTHWSTTSACMRCRLATSLADVFVTSFKWTRTL
eukprot:Amastigsp_a176958_48.p4 type:complete len:115 gc:universal Amastigsp_a176958_48:2703-3047(+)